MASKSMSEHREQPQVQERGRRHGCTSEVSEMKKNGGSREGRNWARGGGGFRDARDTSQLYRTYVGPLQPCWAFFFLPEGCDLPVAVVPPPPSLRGMGDPVQALARFSLSSPCPFCPPANVSAKGGRSRNGEPTTSRPRLCPRAFSASSLCFFSSPCPDPRCRTMVRGQ